MADPRAIPCLLLDGETLVKTTRFASPVYVGDPVNVLSIFNDFEVDEIALLDIGAARSRQPSALAFLAHLAEECFIPLAYGGGLESLSDMTAILRIGFEKLVLGTALATHPEVVVEAVKRFGSQAVVGAVDVRGAGAAAAAVVHGGADVTGSDPVRWARRAEAMGVGEILLTSIDREGSMSGFDLDLVRAVSAAVSVPVIAHGGAGRRKDLAGPIQAGASAVAAGSLFVFQGQARGVLIDYPPRAQLEALLT